MRREKPFELDDDHEMGCIWNGTWNNSRRVWKVWCPKKKREVRRKKVQAACWPYQRYKLWTWKVAIESWVNQGHRPVRVHSTAANAQLPLPRLFYPLPLSPRLSGLRVRSPVVSRRTRELGLIFWPLYFQDIGPFK